MVCDHAFGSTEQHLRRVPNLYVPNDYIFHIEVSVSAGYKVMHMTQAMFLNTGIMEGHITKCQALGSTLEEA